MAKKHIDALSVRGELNADFRLARACLWANSFPEITTRCDPRLGGTFPTFFLAI
jgi:hypothetical protein